MLHHEIDHGTDWHRDEDGTYRPRRTTHYEFDVIDDERIRFTRDGISKTVRVKRDSAYVYRALKTHIKADGGARGLFDGLLADDEWKHRAVSLADHAIDAMRAA